MSAPSNLFAFMKEAKFLAHNWASKFAVVGDYALPNARTKIDLPFLEYYSFKNYCIDDVVLPNTVDR